MPGSFRICILLAGFFNCLTYSFSQSVIVRSINIYGLEKTRTSIVHRELTFAVGDSLVQNDLGVILERNQNNLLNMGLFNEVLVNISEWDTHQDEVDVHIEVKESWYIYVLPIVDLADRNFNVWWTTYEHDFSRINIGARLNWLNFSGRNDKLKGKLQFGYTPQQELEYRFPYLNRRQTLGITTSFLHSINKEVNYANENNQQLFVNLDERKIQERWQASVKAQYRPSFFIKYELSLSYQHLQVAEEIIADYNPQYFVSGKSQQDVFSVAGSFEYDNRDLKIFPAKGMKAFLMLDKVGLGGREDENILRGTISYEYNLSMGKRLQHRIATIGQYSFIRDQPSFVYYEGLGRNIKYVSGYELYLMDGLDFVVGKYQIAYKVLEENINFGKGIPIEAFQKMPFKLYFSLLAETGYANDPFTGSNNPLSNRWLYGGGPAATIMVYNNFLLQFSYCTNHLGDWGFYIHNKTSF